MLGLVAWGFFFSWGNFTLNFHDWSAVTAPRLQFLKDAAVSGQFPLHISNWDALNTITDRYLSVPDTILSPQMYLLRWMEIPLFAFLNLLAFYAAGFWGLVKIQAKFTLSPLVFTILFLLFNFNGHILSHLSVGHYTWTGYFLFPFLVLLVLQLVEGDRSWSWTARWSVLLLIMALQGSFHQFVWIILFLFLLGVLIPRLFWPAVRGALFACLAVLVRLLPPALLYGQLANEYVTGYPTLGSIWDWMVQLAVPNDYTLNQGLSKAVGSWEMSLYVSLIGAVFLVGFGLVSWLAKGRSGIERRLLLPLAALTLLSLGRLFFYFQQLPIPLFSGERVSTRMVSLVIAFLLVIAAAECQSWLNLRRGGVVLYGGLTFLLLFLAHDLWQNLSLWRIDSAASLFPAVPFIPAEWTVMNNLNDGGYLRLIQVGLAATLVTLAGLGFLAWREKRSSLEKRHPA